MLDDQDVRERVAGVEGLLEQLESLPDSDAKTTAMATVEGLLDLYGEALARMVESVSGLDLGLALDAFARDELVSHLLLLHGVHPVGVETRVRQALDEVRPYLASHGGSVELLGVEAGVARLRLNGSCNGCPSSTQTLKLAIEEAIQKVAPELERIDAEGVAPAGTAATVPLIQLGAPPPRCPL